MINLVSWSANVWNAGYVWNFLIFYGFIWIKSTSQITYVKADVS